MIDAESVAFHCWRAPVQLTPLTRAVLHILKDARGVYASRGLTSDEILARGYPRTGVSLATLRRARGCVERACGELVSKGLAREVGGRWKRA